MIVCIITGVYTYITINPLINRGSRVEGEGRNKDGGWVGNGKSDK